MKQIKRIELRKRLDEINEQFRKNGFKVVGIENDYMSPVVKLEVNWSSYCGMTPEETKEFAEMLLKASEIAKNSELNGYILMD